MIIFIYILLHIIFKKTLLILADQIVFQMLSWTIQGPDIPFHHSNYLSIRGYFLYYDTTRFCWCYFCYM